RCRTRHRSSRTFGSGQCQALARHAGRALRQLQLFVTDRLPGAVGLPRIVIDVAARRGASQQDVVIDLTGAAITGQIRQPNEHDHWLAEREVLADPLGPEADRAWTITGERLDVVRAGNPGQV